MQRIARDEGKHTLRHSPGEASGKCCKPKLKKCVFLSVAKV